MSPSSTQQWWTEMAPAERRASTVHKRLSNRNGGRRAGMASESSSKPRKVVTCRGPGDPGVNYAEPQACRWLTTSSVCVAAFSLKSAAMSASSR